MAPMMTHGSPTPFRDRPAGVTFVKAKDGLDAPRQRDSSMPVGLSGETKIVVTQEVVQQQPTSTVPKIGAPASRPAPVQLPAELAVATCEVGLVSSSDSSTDSSESSSDESTLGEPPVCTISEPTAEQRADHLNRQGGPTDHDMTPAERAEFCARALELVTSLPVIDRMVQRRVHEGMAGHRCPAVGATGDTSSHPDTGIAIVRGLLGVMEVRVEMDLPPWADAVPRELYTEFNSDAVDDMWQHMVKAAQLKEEYEDKQAAKLKAAADRLKAKAAGRNQPAASCPSVKN